LVSALILTLGVLSAPDALAGSFGDHRLGEFYPIEHVQEAAAHRVSDAVVYFGGSTGFIVDARGYVLTNDHVREVFGRSGTVRRAYTEAGSAESLRVELVFSDSRHDVALYRIKSDGRAFPTIEIDARRPSIGEPVFVVGHPHSRSQQVSFGTVLADGLEISGRPSLEYSAQTWWGSSGSPVLDADGRAIAIHWGWDEHGVSNGRLTGVPFHQLAKLEPLRPYLGGTPSSAAPSRSTQRCDDPEAWSLRTELVARDRTRNASGRGLDQLRVHAVGPQDCAVDGVAFQLHPSFSEPWQWSEGRRPLRLRAWGRFDAGAWVVLESGTVVGFRDRISW
jgi:hypothetical protein